MNLLPVDLCCTKHFFRFSHYIELLRGPNNIENNKIFCSNTFYCALLRKVHEENACCTSQLDSPIRLLPIFQSNSTTLSNLFVFTGNNICWMKTVIFQQKKEISLFFRSLKMLLITNKSTRTRPPFL